MQPSSVRPGDLAIFDTNLNRLDLYIELRSVPDKRFYSDPRVVVDPNDIILVLDVDVSVSLILTSQGQRGWIDSSVLQVVAKRPKTH